MITRTKILFVSLAGAMLLVGCKTTPQEEPAQVVEVEPVTILLRDAGSEESRKQAELILINSEAQLDEEGREGLEKLGVDLVTQSLVIWALGEKAAGHSVEITGVQQKGDTLHVQATIRIPGEGAAVTEGVTYPYAVAVITKVSVSKVQGDPEYVTATTQRAAEG